MLKLFSLFIIGLITFFVSHYLFSVITCHKYIVNKKVIIFSIIFSFIPVVTSLNLVEKLNFIGEARILIINVVANLMHMNIFKEKFNRTVLAALFNYILMMISETILVLIFVYGIRGIFTPQFITQNPIGIIFSNLTILAMTVILIKIKYVKLSFIKIINWYAESKIIRFIALIVLAFGLIAFFTYQNFAGIQSIIYFGEINITLILVLVFVIGYFHECAKNSLILTDYDQLMKYVETYEKVIADKNKNQHEYKNQLILLKSMIKENDVNSCNYINKLIQIEDGQENYQYLFRLKSLPSGGLKGFILYKIDIMLQKGIVPFVDISNTLSEDGVWDRCEKNLQDISRAIGVYLDNAIEAAIKSKDKFVLFDVEFANDEVIFTISNTYPSYVDFSKIGKENYTTKGEGHGNGLELIKEIINKNEKLEQYREINGIYYVQKLIVK